MDRQGQGQGKRKSGLPVKKEPVSRQKTERLEAERLEAERLKAAEEAEMLEMLRKGNEEYQKRLDDEKIAEKLQISLTPAAATAVVEVEVLPQNIKVHLIDRYKGIINAEMNLAKTIFLQHYSDKIMFFPEVVIQKQPPIQPPIQLYPFYYMNHIYWSNASKEWWKKNSEYIKSKIEPDAQTNSVSKNLQKASVSTQEVSSLSIPDEFSVTPILKSSKRSKPSKPQLIDIDIIYNQYLNEVNIFTIKSELIPKGGQIDLMMNADYKKNYSMEEFDTKCLVFGIIFYNLFKLNQDSFNHALVNDLTEKYKGDYDHDDANELAQYDLSKIKIMYNIAKDFMSFILTGNIYKEGYVKSQIEWINDQDDRGTKIGIDASNKLFKKNALMTEVMFYSLFMWSFTIPQSIFGLSEKASAKKGLSEKASAKKGLSEKASAKKGLSEKALPIQNIKLYTGIGQDARDANYADFVKPVLDNNDTIQGSFMVSTAYSFDAAANFCKGGSNTFNMLEFILGPGIELPIIASSANEAEILLKPGNIYKYVKTYYLTYIRSRAGTEGLNPMEITVYQFVLIDDTNVIGNSYKDFSVAPADTSLPDNSDDSYNVSDSESDSADDSVDDLGGGSKSRRIKTNKQRKTKRKSRRTNKRKSRRTNKRKSRRTNKRKSRRI